MHLDAARSLLSSSYAATPCPSFPSSSTSATSSNEKYRVNRGLTLHGISTVLYCTRRHCLVHVRRNWRLVGRKTRSSDYRQDALVAQRHIVKASAFVGNERRKQCEASINRLALVRRR